MSKYFFCLLMIGFSFRLKAQEKDTVTVIGVGDIMMGSNYPNGGTLPPDNGAALMREVTTVLQDADITIGNLEGVLLNDGGTPKTCRDPKVCYVFRSPVSYVDNLVNSGFDVMSLANNHAGDFGEAGRKSSMQTLEQAGIEHAGQTAKPYTTFTREGVRYGFVAFAPNSGCVNINDLAGARSLVMHLDSISDIVIVSFHGGAEGAQYQHVPRQKELFHGEDRGDVYKFSHELIDAGADIIFGHGPHVTRAVEVYKNRFIAYSLGNFCTYGGINVAGVNGLAPIVKVYTDLKGSFYRAKITSTYQTPRSSVKIDSNQRVLKVIQELTQQDFPENTCTIDDSGWVLSTNPR
jgi:poly-gamma-glutamate capsule biosynthesis protein CapA/YwtB (metallophosphatase superfamily)